MTVEQLQMMEASGSHHHMFRHGVDRGDKGTFWPEKPRVDHIPGRGGEIKASTVLTNLQRGNIPTIMQTVVEPVIVAGPHQKAGQGWLIYDMKIFSSNNNCALLKVSFTQKTLMLPSKR
jgi:hypothetical protein